MRPVGMSLAWLLLGSFLSVALAAESGPKGRNTDRKEAARVETSSSSNAPDVRPSIMAGEIVPTGNGAAFEASVPLFNLDWYSVNGGGETEVSSASYGLGVSVGQSVAGFVSGSAYQLGVGFWYGAAGGGGACPIAMTGDVNLSTSLTSADIIYLVNYVFKGMAAPMPCEAAGDVNCSGAVTSADIIYLVNHVFKGMAAPCDVCTLIPGMWTCP